MPNRKEKDGTFSLGHTSGSWKPEDGSLISSFNGFLDISATEKYKFPYNDQ
jgi:hypothetical protein